MHSLPPFIHARNLDAALRFCSTVTADNNEVVVCDAGRVVFVDPVGLCLLAASCHQLSTLAKQLSPINVPEAIAGYLSRMDLFKACGVRYEEKFTRHKREDDLVELCVVDEWRDVDSAARRVARALIGRMPDFDVNAKPDEMTGFVPHEHLQVPLQYIFTELLENAITHGRKLGFGAALTWVAAQYYPTNDRIRLAVVDNGCGFLASLRRHPDLQETTDEAAIRLALRPRVTCNPDLDIAPDQTANQGIGLTVVKEIVTRSQGTMRLASGDCLLEVHGNGRDRAFRVSRWQGAILAIEVRRELLRQMNLNRIIQELTSKPSPRGLRFE